MTMPNPTNDEPVFESFPEYDNFPAQWDLSEMEKATEPALKGLEGPAARLDGAETSASAAPIPLEEALSVFSRDPFPKLRTFPVYWDLPR